LQISASPRGYRSHFRHAGERIWPETNCYLDLWIETLHDLWIETLHDLGLDPVPAFACAPSADHYGLQWTSLKQLLEDLRRLYGLEVRRPAGRRVGHCGSRYRAVVLRNAGLSGVRIDVYNHTPDWLAGELVLVATNFLGQRTVEAGRAVSIPGRSSLTFFDSSLSERSGTCPTHLYSVSPRPTASKPLSSSSDRRT
jgi:hypothetical protein